MMGPLQHPLRVVTRVTWLAWELILIAVLYIFRVVFRKDQTLIEARAQWLQQGCRRVLRVFNAEVRSTGKVPRTGLLVSNHLGYLDILALSALTPSVFVAKSEVMHWPIFGWFARLGGTLFAERERKLQVGELSKELRTLLDSGALVILFPEGTSSGGQTVLPFKSSLLEPATGCGHPLTASLIAYRLEDGDVGEEVCYWKDMTFVPHLINLLSKRRVEVAVQFAELRNGSTNRKDLARQLHAEVLKLKHLNYTSALA
ncbi:MAG TPA: lysophospholipid acyltransferase family protein [Candidatus Limnocylindrales bacterium]|nr:lysophospholipid acyltransferase family protein [Candidatus Limnocylindrales bacterium]